MKTAWFQGLSQEQASNLEAILKNNTLLFTQLRRILQDRWDSIEKRSLDEETYKTPDWASLEAFRNGKRSELVFLMDLLTFERNTKA